VDGHRAYASALAEVKQTGELRQRCRCRTAPYLDNLIEQDHRLIKKRITARLGFRSLGSLANERAITESSVSLLSPNWTNTRVDSARPFATEPFPEPDFWAISVRK
jgi:transposase-like protein